MRVLLALTLLSLAAIAESAEIHDEKVFGQEVKTGKYKHPACLEELANGDLYLAYYGGEGEYANATMVFGSRKAKGATAWTPPEAIASNPAYSLGNPVVWQAPDGVVWLFYVVRFGETWSTSRIAAKISRDGARTWSDSFMVTLLEGTMVRGQPIVLSGGDYYLPIYHETGHDTEFTGPDTTSRFLRCRPGEMRWVESGVIRSKKGNEQPAVVELDERRLLAYCRRSGGYGPTTEGWLIRAESQDGGKTWSEGVNSSFPNPNAAVDFKRLRNGHLLLVYNDHMYERTPLTAALSIDGGQTFAYRRDIASGPGDFAYPTAVQSKDGKIHLVYTAEERTVIRHAVFDESFLLNEARRVAIPGR